MTVQVESTLPKFVLGKYNRSQRCQGVARVESEENLRNSLSLPSAALSLSASAEV